MAGLPATNRSDAATLVTASLKTTVTCVRAPTLPEVGDTLDTKGIVAAWMALTRKHEVVTKIR